MIVGCFSGVNQHPKDESFNSIRDDIDFDAVAGRLGHYSNLEFDSSEGSDQCFIQGKLLARREEPVVPAFQVIHDFFYFVDGIIIVGGAVLIFNRAAV
jgi:hypothetical protein